MKPIKAVLFKTRIFLYFFIPRLYYRGITNRSDLFTEGKMKEMKAIIPKGKGTRSDR